MAEHLERPASGHKQQTQKLAHQAMGINRTGHPLSSWEPKR